MLSGMHASINIHIAHNFFPPSKAANRTVWAPNAGRFDELFAEHPDRLKNLHFAFVVTLRAIRKASAFLNEYDYSASEARRSNPLLLVGLLCSVCQLDVANGRQSCIVLSEFAIEYATCPPAYSSTCLTH